MPYSKYAIFLIESLQLSRVSVKYRLDSLIFDTIKPWMLVVIGIIIPCDIVMYVFWYYEENNYCFKLLSLYRLMMITCLLTQFYS